MVKSAEEAILFCFSRKQWQGQGKVWQVRVIHAQGWEEKKVLIIYLLPLDLTCALCIPCAFLCYFKKFRKL